MTVNVVTAPEGTDIEHAKELLHKNRIEKLPIVDNDFNLVGLITIKDIQKASQYPMSSKDEKGRLLVGAALGATGDKMERLEALLSAYILRELA